MIKELEMNEKKLNSLKGKWTKDMSNQNKLEQEWPRNM